MSHGFEYRAKRTPLIVYDLDGALDVSIAWRPRNSVWRVSPCGAGCRLYRNCQKFQERRRDRELQRAPPRADNCVRQSQHPSGRCGTVRVRERFTEQTSVLGQNGGASLLHARSLAGWTGRLSKERKKRGVTSRLESVRWSRRRHCRCRRQTRYRNVPVVRRTPDIETRHVDDREREACEDRRGAVWRIIGTWFRGLHNSITDVGRLCRAPLRKGGSVISPVVLAEDRGDEREKEREER